MPRRPKLDVVLTEDGYKVEVPKSLAATKERQRFFFQRKSEAVTFAAGWKKTYHERGAKASIIDPELAKQALAAVELLKPFNVSILDAARHYANHHSNPGHSKTVRQAWEEYIAKLVTKKRADATINDYQGGLKTMPQWFLDLTIGEVTVSETKLEKALDASTSKRGPTWNRRLREARAVIREAARTTIKPEEIRRGDPEILTPEKAEKVMREAVREGCARAFSVLLFAGVRPFGELQRISEGNLREKHIDISSEESKTRDDRHIPISDNLRKWLDATKYEDLVPANWKRKYQAVRKRCGIVDQDVPRHTYASAIYRLEGEHGAIRALGHKSFRTTERFYKRAMSEEDALAYMAITPESVREAA